MGDWLCPPGGPEILKGSPPMGVAWAPGACPKAARTPFLPASRSREQRPGGGGGGGSAPPRGHPRPPRTRVGLPGLDEFLQQLLGDGAAGPEVLGHPQQRLLLPHPVLQHLRRRLHEVPLHVRSAEHGELGLWGRAGLQERRTLRPAPVNLAPRFTQTSPDRTSSPAWRWPADRPVCAEHGSE